jgi:hypothetical protein
VSLTATGLPPPAAPRRNRRNRPAFDEKGLPSRQRPRNRGAPAGEDSGNRRPADAHTPGGGVMRQALAVHQADGLKFIQPQDRLL